MKKTIIALLLTVATSVAFSADQTASAPEQLLPAGVGEHLTPEQISQAEAAARAISQASMNSLGSQAAKNTEPLGQQVARRADDIANAAMAQDRKDILEFLGIDMNGQSSLYYFVSWSMPLEMIRAYAVEAMWTGGTLIFKGMPGEEGMNLKEYVTNYLSKLVYGKGASSAISIDPRLYDAYNVTTVPTIVYTEERANFQCGGNLQRTINITKETTAPISLCPPVDENKYWKISGAVTADYALRAFVDDGAKGAKVYLDALSKGFATGMVPKVQQPFAGEWKDAISPEQIKATQDAIRAVQQTGAGLKASAPAAQSGAAQ